MSSYFKCSNPSCGYTVRILAKGDTARCSQCGSIMYRCHHKTISYTIWQARGV